ncbi:Protein mesA [Diplonema papillatum]|nr:Protein mesA [Diplonema papillatum]
MASSLSLAADSDDDLVDFIALAEFDIDTGAVVRAYYPPTSEDSSYLCEQMLPDRCEGHAEQRTLFFLNRQDTQSLQSEASGIHVRTFRHRQDSNASSSNLWVRMSEHENERLTYSLTGSKMGRGELLLSAPDGTMLYDIPMGKDASLREVDQPALDATEGFFLVEGAGCGFDFGFMLLDPQKDRASVQSWMSETAKPSAPLLFCLNCVKSRRDPTVRRGSIVKSIAWGCRNQTFLFCFEGLMNSLLDCCLDLKGEQEHEVQMKLIEQAYRIVNNREELRLRQAPRWSSSRVRVWRDIIKDPSKCTHAAQLSFLEATKSPQTFKIQVPLHMSKDDVFGAFGNCTLLLDVFKESLMVILNAVLSGKRVVCLSYKRSAGQLCEAVSGIATLLIPPLTGLHEHHVFPYTSLTCMSAWRSLSACIVGVTNPMFEHRTEWWDVLCDLDNGKVKVSPTAVIVETAHQAQDQAFITKMLACRARARNETKGDKNFESFLRYKTRQYFQATLSLPEGTSPHVQDQDALLEANAGRIKRFKAGGMAQHLLQLAPREKQLMAWLSLLRGSKQLSEEESISIYQGLIKSVRTEEDLLSLLALMPPEADGLFPLALGLFHPSFAVRLPCVAFLRRLDGLPEGQLVLHSLNAFLLLAFERNSKLMPNTH